MINTAITISYKAWNTDSLSWQIDDGANHALRGTADGVVFTPASAITQVDSTNYPGLYRVVVAADENIGEVMTLGGKSSTANVVLLDVYWGNKVNVAQIEGTDATDQIGASVWTYATRTLTSISALLSSIWTYVSRTLTQSTVDQDEPETLTFVLYNFADNSVSIAPVTVPDPRDQLYLSVKESRSAVDSNSIIQIAETGGLLQLNKAAPTDATWGTLTVVGTTVTFTLEDEAAALLGTFGELCWDLKAVTAAGAQPAIAQGLCAIRHTITQALT